MNSNTEKKLKSGVIVIVLLSLCLVFTSTVLAMSTLPIGDNIFKTGLISIKLGGVNGNKEYYFDKNHKLITEDEYLFEPGSIVEKKFFIENIAGNKGYDVYYKIYFDNIKGKLANEIDICLKDEKGFVYFNGKAKDFVKNKVKTANNTLSVLNNHNKHYYTISFHYPEECGNVGQGKILEFDLCAKAVQTKNNPNREFEYKE